MLTVIVFSHLRWSFIYQRPQHLMSELARHYRVVYIEENAEPLTLQTRGSDEDDSQFVLEVPGGWARAHGVERGVNVRFVDID